MSFFIEDRIRRERERRNVTSTTKKEVDMDDKV